MDSCFPAEACDLDSLFVRVRAFISDPDSETVTGPRRFGRSDLVSAVRAVAIDMGLTVWTSGRRVRSPDIILFDHWDQMSKHADLMAENPDACIMYGQDLCHQVPAVVRYRDRV